jgi:Asp-tRNA(Asn)/Glu-tRNA(Gln) amidotransferase A subunit family amidase
MILRELARELASGRPTSRELVERSLASIASPEGQGGVAFRGVDADNARKAADAHDLLRAQAMRRASMPAFRSASRASSTFAAR